MKSEANEGYVLKSIKTLDTVRRSCQLGVEGGKLEIKATAGEAESEQIGEALLKVEYCKSCTGPGN